MEASNEVKVKDEPIDDSQSISDTRKSLLSSIKPNKTKSKEQSMKVKEEPIDIEIQTSKKIFVKTEEEEKFSATEQFTNKASIAFLNEETTNQATTSKRQMKSK